MALCADDDNFMSYSSGIYEPTVDDCSCYPNHTILAVGYGYDQSTDTEYWIILNSWNTWWGDQGYAKLSFGISGNPDCGMCGMFCDWISFPTVVGRDTATEIPVE
jgi:C1A family cysteine protease